MSKEMLEQAETGTAVATITPVNAALVFADSKKVDDVLEALRRTAFESLGKPDMSTPKGREKIASVAHSVARTKVAMVAEDKKLTEGWRDATNKVNAECKRIEINADALKAEIRRQSSWPDQKPRNAQ